MTTGKVSSTIRKEAQAKAKKISSLARVEIFDGGRAMLLFRDYLDGVAPPIPTLDLQLESGQGVTVNSVSQRYDQISKIETWVFSMRGDAIGALYERYGRRLFARNIRGFIGNTAVERSRCAAVGALPQTPGFVA